MLSRLNSDYKSEIKTGGLTPFSTPGSATAYCIVLSLLKENDAIAKKRMSTEQENKEIEMLEDHEVKPGDDVVWTHIKRASLKRRESSQNMLKNDGKTNTPQKGSRRPESSRKGKDVAKKTVKSESSSPAPIETEPIEDRKPIFTFTDEKGVDRDWDKPGPSNVIY